MNINQFARLFDSLGTASDMLGGNAFSNSIASIESNLNALNDCYTTGLSNLFDEIENKLILAFDKEIYLLSILRKFHHYELLNTSLGASEERKAGLKRNVERIRTSHKYIKEYQLNPAVDSDNIPLTYLITCWSLLNNFMKRLDDLALQYGVDLLELQKKHNENIWYRVTNGQIVSIQKSAIGEIKDDGKAQPELNEYAREFRKQLVNCNRDAVMADLIDQIQGRKGKPVAMVLLAYEKKGYLRKGTYTIADVHKAFGAVGNIDSIRKYYNDWGGASINNDDKTTIEKMAAKIK